MKIWVRPYWAVAGLIFGPSVSIRQRREFLSGKGEELSKLLVTVSALKNKCGLTPFMFSHTNIFDSTNTVMKNLLSSKRWRNQVFTWKPTVYTRTSRRKVLENYFFFSFSIENCLSTRESSWFRGQREASAMASEHTD